MLNLKVSYLEVSVHQDASVWGKGRGWGPRHPPIQRMSAPDSGSSIREDSGSGLVVGRQAGGDLSNIWKKNLWKLGFGCGKVAVQHLVGVVGFRRPLP